MKHWIWAIVILIIAVGLVAESRYTLIVNSPIVAKLDNLTGDVWIANSGAWRKVEHKSKDEQAVRDTSVKSASVAPGAEKKPAK